MYPSDKKGDLLGVDLSLGVFDEEGSGRISEHVTGTESSEDALPAPLPLLRAPAQQRALARRARLVRQASAEDFA